jgi:hypothetical protein
MSRQNSTWNTRPLVKLSPPEIRMYAENAGFRPTELDTAVAVALAESAGDPDCYDPETAAPGGTPEGQGSYGLWQVYLKEHPEFANANLKDPQVNACAAFAIYRSARSSFEPWSTYTEGKYRAFLPAPAAAPPGETA